MKARVSGPSMSLMEGPNTMCRLATASTEAAEPAEFLQRSVSCYICYLIWHGQGWWKEEQTLLVCEFAATCFVSCIGHYHFQQGRGRLTKLCGD